MLHTVAIYTTEVRVSFRSMLQLNSNLLQCISFKTYIYLFHILIQYCNLPKEYLKRLRNKSPCSTFSLLLFNFELRSLSYNVVERMLNTDVQ